VNRWAVKIIRMQDHGFPDHHVGLAWAVALLVIPPAFALGAAPPLLVVAFGGVAWLATCVPLALMATLDWARKRPRVGGRARAVGRSSVQTVFIALGAVGVGAGGLILVRTARDLSIGRLTPSDAALPVSLSIGIACLGVGATTLPSRRSRGSAMGGRGHDGV
jgi:hypothetical protein